MKAIILAAGTSSRLYPITLDTPKCLLEVAGRSIIDRQLEALEEFGIEDIVLVVGYKAEVIRERLADRVRYCYFDNFEKTNNLHTLLSAKDELNQEVLCLLADVIFEKKLLEKLIRSEFSFTLVVDSTIRPGTMRVKIKNGSITKIGNHVDVENGDGNFIGIAKFSAEAARLLANEMEELVKHGNESEYYTIALESLATRGHKIGFINTDDAWWTEIDTKEDLDDAREHLNQSGEVK